MAPSISTLLHSTLYIALCATVALLLRKINMLNNEIEISKSFQVAMPKNSETAIHLSNIKSSFSSSNFRTSEEFRRLARADPPKEQPKLTDIQKTYLTDAHRHGSSHRNIFIDLGATGGEAVEALLGGDQGMAGEGFVNLGTDPTLKKWDIYMVEANSIHKNAEDRYKAKTLVDHADFVNSISLYCPAAVGAHAGKINVVFDGPGSQQESSVGTSIFADKVRRDENGKAFNVGPEIPLMDIADFLRNEVGAKHTDFIIIKIDIEGSEYEVLRRLFGSGIIRWINHVFVEWHWSHGEFKDKFVMPHQCIQWLTEDLEGISFHEWNR